jgi:hypothetical protein
MSGAEAFKSKQQVHDGQRKQHGQMLAIVLSITGIAVAALVGIVAVSAQRTQTEAKQHKELSMCLDSDDAML